MFWTRVSCVSSMLPAVRIKLLLTTTVYKPEPYQGPVLWGRGVRRWITIVSSLISILGSHNVTASPQEGRKLEHKEEERKWWPCPWLAQSVVKVPWQCRGTFSQPMSPLVRWLLVDSKVVWVKCRMTRDRMPGFLSRSEISRIWRVWWYHS